MVLLCTAQNKAITCRVFIYVECALFPPENAVICQRRKENFNTCYSPPNDCVKKADRQRYITCTYDPKKYYVNTSSVTPSTVTVVVLNVSPQSEGTYVCRPVSLIQGQLNSCQVNVLGTVILHYGVDSHGNVKKMTDSGGGGGGGGDGGGGGGATTVAKDMIQFMES